MANYHEFQIIPCLLSVLLLSLTITYVSGHYRFTPLETAQADLALQLLRSRGSPEESTVWSPLSIALALSMLNDGARGQTQQEISKLLSHGRADSAEISQYYSRLFASTKADNITAQGVHIANKLYIENGTKLREKYLKLIYDRYGGCLQQLNFTKSDLSATEINRWIKNNTESRIQDIVHPSMFSAETQIFLITAMYLKLSWKLPYFRTMIEKHPFYFDEVNATNVKMLHHRHEYAYYGDNELQIVMLPYYGDKLSLCIFLPTNLYGYKQLGGWLNGYDMLHLISKTRKQMVRIAIPKFRLRRSYNLVSTLRKLGIWNVFEDTANFADISTTPLRLSGVIHETTFEVTEDGTFTKQIPNYPEFLHMIERVPEFIANHPFLFAVVQNNTQILLIGRVGSSLNFPFYF